VEEIAGRQRDTGTAAAFRPPPTVVDTPEPGDVTDAADTDNLQEGDQNGPGGAGHSGSARTAATLTLCQRLASRRPDPRNRRVRRRSAIKEPGPCRADR